MSRLPARVTVRAARARRHSRQGPRRESRVGRIHYDVVRHGSGWLVQTSGYSCECANQLEALVCAFVLAKDLWESLHAPTGVRLRQDDGQWREARAFGAAD